MLGAAAWRVVGLGPGRGGRPVPLALSCGGWGFRSRGRLWEALGPGRPRGTRGRVAGAEGRPRSPVVSSGPVRPRPGAPRLIADGGWSWCHVVQVRGPGLRTSGFVHAGGDLEGFLGRGQCRDAHEALRGPDGPRQHGTLVDTGQVRLCHGARSRARLWTRHVDARFGDSAFWDPKRPGPSVPQRHPSPR